MVMVMVKEMVMVMAIVKEMVMAMAIVKEMVMVTTATVRVHTWNHIWPNYMMVFVLSVSGIVIELCLVLSRSKRREIENKKLVLQKRHQYLQHGRFRLKEYWTIGVEGYTQQLIQSPHHVISKTRTQSKQNR